MRPQRLADRGGRRIRLAALVASIGVGISLASVLWWASGPSLAENPPDLPDPVKQLAEARAAAPYAVKYPSVLPSGASLEHVDWEVSEGSVVAIDVWFRLPAGGRLHIWQTNTKEPISAESTPPGEPILIDGAQWSLSPVDWGSQSLRQLSTRSADGITITMDAPVASFDVGVLTDVAASLE